MSSFLWKTNARRSWNEMWFSTYLAKRWSFTLICRIESELTKVNQSKHLARKSSFILWDAMCLVFGRVVRYHIIWYNASYEFLSDGSVSSHLVPLWQSDSDGDSAAKQTPAKHNTKKTVPAEGGKKLVSPLQSNNRGSLRHLQVTPELCQSYIITCAITWITF